MRKLCLSTKFIHQEIRWNYGIFRAGMLCKCRWGYQFLNTTHSGTLLMSTLQTRQKLMSAWEDGSKVDDEIVVTISFVLALCKNHSFKKSSSWSSVETMIYPLMFGLFLKHFRVWHILQVISGSHICLRHSFYVRKMLVFIRPIRYIHFLMKNLWNAWIPQLLIVSMQNANHVWGRVTF